MCLHQSNIVPSRYTHNRLSGYRNQLPSDSCSDCELRLCRQKEDHFHMSQLSGCRWCIGRTDRRVLDERMPEKCKICLYVALDKGY